MQTNFTEEQLSQPNMAGTQDALTRCLQCGYCLPNCPTHQILDNEYDSPRGRVYLIKQMLEQGGQPADSTVEHLDRCLYCLACMSSCPSFVNYRHLMDHAREYIEDNYTRPFSDRLLRGILATILPHPRRMRLAIHGARLARPLKFLMPATLRGLLELAPRKLPAVSENDRPQVFPALAQRQYRVALMNGCAQQALNTDINDATIRILRRHGCEVVIAGGSGCCGALVHHMGKAQESRVAAAKNIRAWAREIDGEGLDAIVINTSGCGTVVKDYAHMFEEHELSAQAKMVSERVKDISELLNDIGLDYVEMPAIRVAYHATCSLQFGQRIRFAPRKLLKAAGFTVLEPRESHVCCGSAGTYHLLQTDISTQLKTRKVENLENCQPDVIAAGNIGCMVQIGSATDVAVVHTVELLDWATGGPKPPALQDVS
jgi:glycolate oxidase iron-sulfur subunit